MSKETPSAPTDSPQQAKDRGTVPLVLGIVGLGVALIPLLGWAGVILGILALVLGALGLSKPVAHSRSRTGLILGIIAIPVGLISLFVSVLLFAFAIPGLPNGPGPQPTPISATFTPAP